MSKAAARLAGFLLCALPLVSPAAHAGDAPRAGMSAERLQRLDDFLQANTRPGGYLGAVALVSRGGDSVYWQAHGSQDLARATPMRRDSIFRVYSMTKTVATVAVLVLMEQGRLGIDDPVSTYLPELSGLQVLEATTSEAPRLRAPARALTIRHLLTHTAGFATRSDDPREAVQALERAAPDTAPDHAEFVRRLARVPLAADPGTRFAYDGVQIEVASRIVEAISGQPFDRFVHERILDPLRMSDTGFSVPVAKRHRVVDITHMGPDGRLALDVGPSATTPGVPLKPYPGGAGGLYSTAPDFLRFCRMLLDGGQLDGTRILGRKTVEFMMTNHLTHLDPPVTQFSDAEGFGLGGSILLDPARRGRLGSVGQFGWSGAASTYFTIDPKERLIAILLLQHLPNDAPDDLPRLSTPFYNLVYQAIE